PRADQGDLERDPARVRSLPRHRGPSPGLCDVRGGAAPAVPRALPAPPARRRRRVRHRRGAAGVSVSLTAAPPSYEEARTRRHKARAAGLHPDYWYAVEHEAAVTQGRVVEVTFWGTSIALYR